MENVRDVSQKEVEGDGDDDDDDDDNNTSNKGHAPDLSARNMIALNGKSQTSY